MTKRTLPTVTLDDIFKAGPCWVTTEGPVAAAQKMAQLVPGGKVSYRTLHELVRDRRITEPEAGWATMHLSALKEGASIPGLRGWGTPESLKAIDEWENPKGPAFNDLKPGALFRIAGYQRTYMKTGRSDKIAVALDGEEQGSVTEEGSINAAAMRRGVECVESIVVKTAP